MSEPVMTGHAARPEPPRDTPAGCEWIAEPESGWRPTAAGLCRGFLRGHVRCDQPAVVSLLRGDVKRTWYGYCLSHSHGRWAEGGQVMHWVLRESGDGAARRAIEAALEPLDDDARGRVLRWAADKFGVSMDEARESWQARAVMKILADAGYGIVRAESEKAEWGSRDPAGKVFEYHWIGEGAARALTRRPGDVLARRTVTYGPWEVVTDEH